MIAFDRRERSLREQVIHNGNAANDNIDNIQDAFEVVTTDAKKDYADLRRRIDETSSIASGAQASLIAMQDRLGSLESRVAQFGVVE